MSVGNTAGGVTSCTHSLGGELLCTCGDTEESAVPFVTWSVGLYLIFDGNSKLLVSRGATWR